ncbi:MAG: hypothetical protein IPN17_04050 [Deltaproteobacteria bacterium]|nr:hypothetical protein [Deltaproteobacteria bacterium]
MNCRPHTLASSPGGTGIVASSQRKVATTPCGPGSVPCSPAMSFTVIARGTSSARPSSSVIGATESSRRLEPSTMYGLSFA